MTWLSLAGWLICSFHLLLLTPTPSAYTHTSYLHSIFIISSFGYFFIICSFLYFSLFTFSSISLFIFFYFRFPSANVFFSPYMLFSTALSNIILTVWQNIQSRRSLKAKLYLILLYYFHSLDIKRKKMVSYIFLIILIETNDNIFTSNLMVKVPISCCHGKQVWSKMTMLPNREYFCVCQSVGWNIQLCFLHWYSFVFFSLLTLVFVFAFVLFF